MHFFFLLLHAFFAASFYFLGKYLEVAVFAILWGLFFYFFHPSFLARWSALSAHSDSHGDGHGHDEHGSHWGDHEGEAGNHSFSLSSFVFQRIKQLSYYLSFGLFYLSLYGIAYGINATYGFFTLSESYSLLTLCLSTLVSGIYLLFYHKKNPTLFMIFRSNAIVFWAAYACLFAFATWKKTWVDFLFLSNALLSFLAVAIVLVFDPFVDTARKRSIYALWMLFLSVASVYFSTVFIQGRILQILIFVVTVLSFFAFEVIPAIPRFRFMRSFSRYVWLFMSYIGIVLLILDGISYPIEWVGVFFVLYYAAFHVSIHFRFENYSSYVLFLSLVYFLYVRYFLGHLTDFFSVFAFAFFPGLSIVFLRYISYFRHAFDVAIALYTGIVFSVGIFLYYFLLIEPADVLSVSFVFLAESFLFFFGFLQWKK